MKELPVVLRDPVKGASMAPVDSAFTQSVGRPVTFFEWLEEKTPQDEGPPKFNPMLEVASLAMVSGGRVCSAATAHGMPIISGPSKSSNRISLLDYPWGALGSGTVVDVGGGLGSACAACDIRLLTTNAFLRINESRARENVCGPEVRHSRLPSRARARRRHVAKRVSRGTGEPRHLDASRFFQANPIKDAAVFLLRHIMCVRKLV